MKYKIEKYELKNGIKGVTVIFDDEENRMISSFFAVEVAQNPDEIMGLIDNVLSGKSENEQYDGNIFHIDIKKDECFIYDNIENEDKICRIATVEMREIMAEFVKMQEANSQVTKAKVRIGIDAGSTTTKIVAIDETNRVIEERMIKSAPTHDDIRAIFNSCVENNDFDLEDIVYISITGVGAQGFEGTLGGFTPNHVGEIHANTVGSRHVASGMDQYILVSLGTGTSFVKVDGDEYTHMGGLGLGGGTVDGLFMYMLKESGYKNMDSLSSNGDHREVNIILKEVSGGKFEGLEDFLTVSNFGKYNESATREDIAAGIFSLVLENIIQSACLIAKQIGYNKIFFIGGLSASSTYDRVIDIFRRMYPDFVFEKSGDSRFITALGAALTDKPD